MNERKWGKYKQTMSREVTQLEPKGKIGDVGRKLRQGGRIRESMLPFPNCSVIDERLTEEITRARA